MSDSVSLREHLELQIRHERELRLTTAAHLATELKLQAAEYERRLTVLNHAHEDAIKAQAETVPRETYNVHVRETDKKLDELLKEMRGEIRPLQDRGQFNRGRDMGWLAIGTSIGIAIGGFAVTLVTGLI